MSVNFTGNTTTFTGTGTVNPQKLVIPNIATQPGPLATILRTIINYINNLKSSAFGAISHTYAVSGTIVVPSGATGYLPPFFMPVASGQGVALFGVYTLLRAGTADLTIEQNGSAIATSVPCSTTPTFTPIEALVGDNDRFQPVVTSVSTADGLTCSFYFGVIN